MKEKTSVYTAAVEENQCHWTRQVEVRRRMLHSVCLNAELKARLQDDLEEYLHESSAGWYASRNIPYRRGYLLYGEPGCGKTSFAMSVAGEFKLSISSISLLNKHLTDTRLLTLVRALQPGTLLLLEDIDCAGIINRAEPAEGQDERLRVVVDAEVKIPIDTVMDIGHGNQIKKEITDTSKPERPTQVTVWSLERHRRSVVTRRTRPYHDDQLPRSSR